MGRNQRNELEERKKKKEDRPLEEQLHHLVQIEQANDKVNGIGDAERKKGTVLAKCMSGREISVKATKNGVACSHHPIHSTPPQSWKKLFDLDLGVNKHLVYDGISVDGGHAIVLLYPEDAVVTVEGGISSSSSSSSATQSSSVQSSPVRSLSALGVAPAIIR